MYLHVHVLDVRSRQTLAFLVPEVFNSLAEIFIFPGHFGLNIIIFVSIRQHAPCVLLPIIHTVHAPSGGREGGRRLAGPLPGRWPCLINRHEHYVLYGKKALENGHPMVQNLLRLSIKTGVIDPF